MGDLTENFSLKEFAVSSSHPELGEVIWDSFSKEDMTKMFYLARMILQPVRDLIGRPVRINSGKRSASLNKLIGGAEHSDHLYLLECAAVDFTLDIKSDVSRAFQFLRQRSHCFGQLIRYPASDGSDTFLHCSLPSLKHYGEILEKVDGVFRTYSGA